MTAISSYAGMRQIKDINYCQVTFISIIFNGYGTKSPPKRHH